VSPEEKWDLLVTLHTPTLGTGRAMRTYGVARALATHRRLKLLYVPFGASQPDPAFAVAGIELHEVRPSRGAKRLLAFARARTRGVPRDFARGVSPELAAAAKRLARDERCGRVIADGPTAAATLLTLARERPVIYNAHNLESAFRHELDGERGLRGLARFERKLLSRASESWMVSSPDMDAARELCPTAKLRLVPNVVDVAAITPVPATTPQPRAVFVANFSYEPNRNALRFLLREVMPLVWDQLSHAHLTLVGGGLREALDAEGLASAASDPRVDALGFVEDLAHAYGHARCAVVPLLQGGGTPLKLLEALAYGLPTVTTPRAGHALGLRDGVDCLFADGARPFANALVSVLRDGAPQLGAAARKVAQERYSVQALARILSS
jgi:glycosyltransferase involved in cell wall biosynthesis